MAETKKRVQLILLVLIAVGAVFGIGYTVGRILNQPPVAAPQDPALRYDLTPYSAVAPELLGYKLLRKIPLDLKEPRGIASLQDGTIYACGDGELVVVDRKGAVKARFPLDGGPRCVAADGSGKAYVGMLDHVEVVDVATGKATVWPDLGSQAIVTSIAVGASGVYVADSGNGTVLRFDAGGKLVGSIDKGFVVPSAYFDVAEAIDGSVFVANTGMHRVEHYTPEGTLLGSWGKASLDVDGFGGCCNPAHMALLPCGSLVTSEKGVLRVKVHEPDGTLTAVVAAPGDFPAGEVSLDLATRKANGGEVLVLVPGDRAVRVYCRKGVSSNE